MAKKKKKHQGHYCRICGEYKANEKFSGKGHAQHICKSCMSKRKKGEPIAEKIEFDEPQILDYDLDDMEYDMFNPDIDVMPSFLEPIPYKKLDNDTRTALKLMWEEFVEDYWEEEHQIPLANDFNLLMDEMVGIFEEAENTLIKMDKNLRHALQDIMLVKINKLFESEHNISKE